MIINGKTLIMSKQNILSCLNKEEKMFLRSIEGNYSPSFFLIHLMSNESGSAIISNNKATFVHEYIHFIQDIIFPYCIRTNMSYFCWFDNICKYGKSNKQIKRPFNNWNQNCSNLDMQFKQTFGSLKDQNKELKIKEIKSSKKHFSAFDSRYSMRNRELDVYKYELIFENNSKYQLGARDLLEYITYKIETKHYGGKNEFPKYPYKTIDYLFEYYSYSDLDEAKKIFIAEYCMYNDNPIHYLFNIFFHNKNRMELIYGLDIDKLYDKFSNVCNISIDGVNETFAHKVERRSNEFLNELKNLYHHSDQLCNWIEHINSYARKKFLNRFIFTELFIMKKNEFEEYMSTLYSELNYPPILNKEEKMIYINNANYDFEYLYILEAFINFIKGDKRSNKCCPITGFCKSNYNINCTGRYDVQNEYDDNCPYKKFLNLNGLSGVTITN